MKRAALEKKCANRTKSARPLDNRAETPPRPRSSANEGHQDCAAGTVLPPRMVTVDPSRARLSGLEPVGGRSGVGSPVDSAVSGDIGLENRGLRVGGTVFRGTNPAFRLAEAV